MNLKLVWRTTEIALAFILPLLLMNSVKASGFIVHGIVSVKGTSDPVPEAALTSPYGDSVSTNSDGRFEINIREAGTTALIIEKQGFETETITCSGRDGQTVELTIALRRLPAYRDETVVEAQTVPDIQPVQNIAPVRSSRFRRI